MKYLVYLSVALLFVIIVTCALFYVVIERVNSIETEISLEIDAIRQRRQSYDSLIADYKQKKIIRDKAWKDYLDRKKLSKKQ